MTMKFIYSLILSASFAVICSAESFDELLRMAEQSTNLQKRFELYDQAVKAGSSDAQKYQAAKAGFEAAQRSKENASIIHFGTILSKLPGVPDAERAEAYFQSLILTEPASARQAYIGLYSAPKEAWLKFLAMQGKTDQREVEALLRLARDTAFTGPYALSEECLAKALNHKALPPAMLNSVTLDYADALQRSGKRIDALKVNGEVLAKKLSSSLRIRALTQKARLLTSSQEYYFEPSADDIASAYAAYEDIRKIQGAGKEQFSNAMTQYVHFAFDRKEYQKTVQIADKVLNDKRHPVNLSAWQAIQTFKGRALLELKQYQAALTVFEKLSQNQYRPGDTQRYLGAAYYGLKEYTLALGCYKTALDSLKGAEDDRPGWCEAWCRKLTWFTANAARLEAAYQKHEARVGQKSASVSSSGGTTAAKSAPKTKPAKKKKQIKKLEDIGTSAGEITEDGLSLE